MTDSAFVIPKMQLSPTSFNITIVNTGTASIDFRIAALTARTSVAGGSSPPLGVSALFAVEQNATLALLGGSKNAISQRDRSWRICLPRMQL